MKVMILAYESFLCKNRYIPIDVFEWTYADKCVKYGYLFDYGFGEYELTEVGHRWLKLKVFS